MNEVLLITKYVFFAVIATILNLWVQRFILSVTTSDINLFIAIILGTLVGLVVKYSLDKKWIFYYKTYEIKNDTKLFLKYSLYGFLTTTIFWIFETFFWLYYKDDLMRELGAVIGLSIGYYIKYKIDKKYVFILKREKNENIRLG